MATQGEESQGHFPEIFRRGVRLMKNKDKWEIIVKLVRAFATLLRALAEVIRLFVK